MCSIINILILLQCIQNGVAVTAPSYLEENEKLPMDMQKSIRVTVNRLLTKEEIAHAASIISSSCHDVLVKRGFEGTHTHTN